MFIEFEPYNTRADWMVVGLHDTVLFVNQFISCRRKFGIRTDMIKTA